MARRDIQISCRMRSATLKGFTPLSILKVTFSLHQSELQGANILQNILDLIEDEYQFGRQVTMFQLVTSSRTHSWNPR